MSGGFDGLVKRRRDHKVVYVTLAALGMALGNLFCPVPALS